MKPLRFAALGAGCRARFQLSAWREVGGAECVALYNRTRSKAEALAREMGIPAVYDDAEELLRNEELDFVDIDAIVSLRRLVVSSGRDGRATERLIVRGRHL